MSYVQKFSCKPPGHEAARQRENQRRHRARVKTQISELEATLAKTQNQLDDALRCIDSLTAEVERLQHTLQQQDSSRQPSFPVRGGDESAASSFGAAGAEHLAQKPQNCGCSPCEKDASHTVESHPVDGSTLMVKIPQSLATRLPNAPSEKQDGSSESLDPGIDCPLLPPPSPGESTMTCRDAFSIIRERSVFGLDFDAATEWLQPGFRRAIVPGSGCRVQTHILFSFVDRIT